MKDSVVVAMGLLAFVVALEKGWLTYLRGWVSASVGGPGINTLTDAGVSASNPSLGGNPQSVTNNQSPQASATNPANGVGNSSLYTNLQ